MLVILTTPEPLTKMEHLLGIQGQKLRVPSIFGRPSIDIPLLFVLVIAIVLFMGGPRAVLPILGLAYFIVSSSPAARN